MGECLAKNMIKEANFSKLFSYSSQMMLKLGRNMRRVQMMLADMVLAPNFYGKNCLRVI